MSHCCSLDNGYAVTLQALKRFTSTSGFWLALLMLILGASYVATLLPGVGYHGDTAKFQFLGKVLGTPHETGYPTYILLNSFFVNLFPLGSLAYKANLLSGLLSIITVILLFRILVLLELDCSLAFITSLTYGLTYTLWSQSVVAEVYTLNILFVAIVLYYFLRWNKTGEDRDFLVGCYFYALSFGNHLTMITFLPAIIYIVWCTDKKIFTNGRIIVWVVLFIILGALQYSYLFLRFHDPGTAYLEMQTPNLERLLWYVTGGQFTSRMFSFSLDELISLRIPMLMQFLLREYLFLIPFIILGIFRFGNKTLNLFLLVSLLGSLIYGLNYDIVDIFVYFIPAYLFLAIYLGKGFAFIVAKGFGWIKSANLRASLVFTLLSAIPLSFYAINYGDVNQSRTTAAARKVEAILETVKRDAVIIPGGYHQAQYFWYYLIGEGRQRNNIYLMHYVNPRLPVDVDTIKAYIDENKPFYLPVQRDYVPAGLSLYCVGFRHRNILEDNGLSVSEVMAHLYKIER